jgi:hypothetical protein
VVAADSFLMKGEQVPAGEYWAGNPAQPAEPVLDGDDLPSIEPAVAVPGTRVVTSAREVRPPAARARVGSGWLVGYSLVLAVAAMFLLAEPGWDLAMRGVGVASIVVAAGLDARVLTRRKRAYVATEMEIPVPEPADTSS